MTYPTIIGIHEVLPHIDGRDEFVVAEREGYFVIDYNFALSDSFDDPIRAECRGLKFNRNGMLIARPLHKFHNIGERDATQPHLLDFSQPHTITEKLDGSMIHPAIVNNELVLMTRMGRTDVARKAERLLTPALTGYCREALEYGFTPIFEFTAPDNRIVIKYDAPQLSLLAVRSNRSGAYQSQAWCLTWARDAGVPLVKHYPSDWNSGQAFLDYARAVTGSEGFVVRFESGLWVKAKGEDYVLKHRAKDSILQEKNVLALILSGGLDDVIPLLDQDDAEMVYRYRDDVLAGIALSAERVEWIVKNGSNLDQKTFATEYLPIACRDALRPLAFSVRAGKPSMLQVQAAVLKATGSQAAVDAARHLHGAVFG